MQESAAAFVTVRNRLTQSVSTTGLMSYDEDYWVAHQAPPPNDIIWGNVKARGWERTVRGLLSWAAFGLMIFFFIPVVAAIQQLINLEGFREDSSVVDWILDLSLIHI